MRERFTHEIDGLKRRLLDLATASDAALLGAMHAIATGDGASAREIIEHDTQIDEAEVGIEEECLKLMALYQPVAGDLRLLVTILKVNGELERAADLAAGIAAHALSSDFASVPEEARFNFDEMATKATHMMREALDAFVCHRPDRARAVIRADDAVDALHAQNVRLVRERLLKNPPQAGYTLRCLAISRALERIADIATNICEDVVYLEEGRIVRHANHLNPQEKPNEPDDFDC